MIKNIKQNWIFLVIPSLFFAGLLTAFVKFNNIGIISNQSIIAYSFLIILGLIYGAILALSPKWVSVLGCALLIFLLILSQIQHPLITNRYIYIFFLASLFCIFYALWQNLDKLLLIIFSIFFIGAFFTSPKTFLTTLEFPVTKNSSNLPAFIHIIVDEHLGIEGISSFNEGELYATELTQNLIEKGFRVYSKAYSRESQTTNSFFSFLNYRPIKDKEVLYELYNNRTRVTVNKHFESLSAQGYLINVLQNNWINLCKENDKISLKKCSTYDYTASLPHYLGNSFAKAIHLVDNSLLFLQRSNYWSKLRTKILKWGKLVELSTFPAIATQDVFPEVLKQLKHVESGNAYFIHLLIPHGPYIYDEKCNCSNAKGTPGGYLAQVQCTQYMINQILNILNENENGKNSTVVIHGDHGVHLPFPALANQNSFNAENIMRNFNTLFIVRSPKFKAGLDERPFPLDYLLPSVLQGKTELSYNEQEQFIHLRSVMAAQYNPYDFGYIPIKILFDKNNKTFNLASHYNEVQIEKHIV